MELFLGAAFSNYIYEKKTAPRPVGALPAEIPAGDELGTKYVTTPTKEALRKCKRITLMLFNHSCTNADEINGALGENDTPKAEIDVKSAKFCLEFHDCFIAAATPKATRYLRVLAAFHDETVVFRCVGQSVGSSVGFCFSIDELCRSCDNNNNNDNSNNNNNIWPPSVLVNVIFHTSLS